MKHGFLILFGTEVGISSSVTTGATVLLVYWISQRKEKKTKRAELSMEAASNSQKLSNDTKLRGMAKEASGGCLADPDGSMDGASGGKSMELELMPSVSSLFLSRCLSLLRFYLLARFVSG
jgi:hypothetical protein